MQKGGGGGGGGKDVICLRDYKERWHDMTARLRPRARASFRSPTSTATSEAVFFAAAAAAEMEHKIKSTSARSPQVNVKLPRLTQLVITARRSTWGGGPPVLTQTRY